MLFGLIVFAAIVLSVFGLTATYNALVAASARTTRAWNELDALLRQRHDEIPKLIEMCEPRLENQRAVFDRVLEARAAILGARQTRSADALGAAERELRAALTALIAAAAHAPELASSPAFGLLRQRNTTLDDEIADRRDRYNQAVHDYNEAIRRVPSNIVALLGGFRALRPLEVEAAADAP